MNIDTTIRIYHNPFYSPYSCSCYMVYIPTIGILLVTNNDAFIVLDRIKFTLEQKDLPDYCRSRGFFNIVDVADNYKTVIWYDQYRTVQSKQNLIDAMSMAETITAQRYVYNLSKSPIYRKICEVFSKLSKIDIK